jgi:hypothetical protein
MKIKKGYEWRYLTNFAKLLILKRMKKDADAED